jgi:glutaminyl-tRNA synthetase
VGGPSAYPYYSALFENCFQLWSAAAETDEVIADGAVILPRAMQNSNSSDVENPNPAPDGELKRDFIRNQIHEDRAQGLNDGRLQTRFPPEPNGHLHIGHAKAICLNFGLAEEEGGLCNLRFDDTNPAAEDESFVLAMQEDIRWLGYDYAERMFFTSDYFERLYELAQHLIRQGLAYVCDLSAEETRAYRGGAGSPGRNSPQRERSVEENLRLFTSMRAGDFDEGHCTLRAKIDMTAANLTLRDPVMYRISHAPHHRTGREWHIYPMYDWAHGQSDALEAITHSLCSLEFENHRPLYDWFLDHLELPDRPRQIEFARLNITHTLVQKRKLTRLVDGDFVSGWDDPRMPTLSGLRRRGYTPGSIREFCSRIGVAKFNSTVDMVVLENCLREDLNQQAARRMGVLDPLKLVIENYPEDREEFVDAINNPEDESMGTRQVPFGREIWIERDDFREEAPRKYHRLKPGKEVRLRYAYYVTCTGFETDPESGEITEVRCTYDPETRGGDSADGRKVRGTIHWVSAKHAIEGELRLFDHLFSEPHPDKLDADGDFTDHLNPNSLELCQAKLEPSVADMKPGEVVQLERKGYFCADSKDWAPGQIVLNRAVALRDSWAKLEKKLGK